MDDWANQSLVSPVRNILLNITAVEASKPPLARSAAYVNLRNFADRGYHRVNGHIPFWDKGIGTCLESPVVAEVVEEVPRVKILKQ